MKTIGLLGCGSIGKRHAENLVKLGCTVPTYDIAIQGNTPEAAANRKAVIAMSDAIVIATPSDQHYRDIIDCGDKPVFIEKPVAFTQAEHKKLELRSKIPDGRGVMVGYNLRFNKAVIETKRLLNEGIIGDLLWSSITVSQQTTKPDYLRDGVTLNFASHEIDMALYLMGPAKVAGAVISPKDDYADIVLVHDNGCRSTVHADYNTHPEIRATTIVGTKGQITIDLVQRWACLVWADGRKPEINQFADSWDENYFDEMQAFLARIDGQTTLGCTGREALMVLEICLKAKKMAGLA